MKKNIITISGFPGSGKSSAAKGVASILGYEHFSSGDFMRNIALSMDLTLNELGQIAENDAGVIDYKIDEEIRRVAQKDKLVIDSRLAFHWIPEAFKVFLDLPLEISKDRIWQNLKNNPLREQSEKANSPEDVLNKIKDRLASEQKRYRDLYNIDYTAKENFDLVVDTSKNNIQETTDMIVAEYKKWLLS